MISHRKIFSAERTGPELAAPGGRFVYVAWANRRNTRISRFCLEVPVVVSAFTGCPRSLFPPNTAMLRNNFGAGAGDTGVWALGARRESSAGRGGRLPRLLLASNR